MDVITAHELWESARHLVDRADELGIAIASISAHSRGADAHVGPGRDVRDDVDRLANGGEAQYYGQLYRRGPAFGASGTVLPPDVVITMPSPSALLVEVYGSGSCFVTRNQLRILRESPTTLTRDGVAFTPDLLDALGHIAARELVTA